MPLHLLGKKSWNVYNKSNIERVKRDEAAAAAREKEAEQRKQEEDAARRLAILRGEEIPSLPAPIATDIVARDRDGHDRESRTTHRKRRRLPGENDTDRDIRYAREDAEGGKREKRTLAKPVIESDEPLVDVNGHIQLVAPQSEDVESTKRQKRDVDDNQGMRFTDACGYRNHHTSKPWYAGAAVSDDRVELSNLAAVADKDVWGNEDPRRKERERSRLVSNDPFAAMQMAQHQLKRSQRDREAWDKQRQVDLIDNARARIGSARREHSRHSHSRHGTHEHNDRRQHRHRSERHRDRHDNSKHVKRGNSKDRGDRDGQGCNSDR